MKALSIKQPWAWLICAGYKDIENRDWFIGRKVASGAVNFAIPVPMRIYVHASKTEDYPNMYAAFTLIELLHGQSDGNIVKQNYIHFKSLGAIIGEVDITGCVTESKSPWFVGKYGFVLANPLLYDKPIPYCGQLGFFEVNLPKSEVKS